MAAKPVILTVDDPSVSRAVARDPRRYGEDHRIVRAESDADALDAVRELRVRGEPVAVLLAYYRMPGMSGLELLEQAMDVAPRARRALLTGERTGLGLDISHRIVVNRHGGDLRLSSAPGRTVFTVRLPPIAPQTEGPPPTAEPPIKRET